MADNHPEDRPVEQAHDFDGIEEMDNDLPRWWLGIFWVTLFLALFYVPYFHWIHPEKLPEAAYLTSKEVENIPDGTVVETPQQIEASLLQRYQQGGWQEEAKGNYSTFCSPCHAADGGGTIGPNFTDDFSIHGGRLVDMVRVITDGVPEKGMVSWKVNFKPEQIENLAFYIYALRGTAPAISKDPQGQKMNPDGTFAE